MWGLVWLLLGTLQPAWAASVTIHPITAETKERSALAFDLRLSERSGMIRVDLALPRHQPVLDHFTVEVTLGAPEAQLVVPMDLALDKKAGVHRGTFWVDEAQRSSVTVKVTTWRESKDTRLSVQAFVIGVGSFRDAPSKGTPDGPG